MFLAIFLKVVEVFFLHAGTSAPLVSRSQSNKGEGRKPLEAKDPR